MIHYPQENDPDQQNNNHQSYLEMEDRPIKPNSSGTYNLNFVDPTNDICSYYNGMSQLQDIIEQYLETVTFHTPPKLDLGTDHHYKPSMKQKCRHLQDSCSVCLCKFKEGQEIKILPCQHCFHNECVIPWFKAHDKCPNCRFSLINKKADQQQNQS